MAQVLVQIRELSKIYSHGDIEVTALDNISLDIAAGEFLTDPGHMEALARFAPTGWQNKNLQAVIATKVINGQPGPPRVVATEFW